MSVLLYNFYWISDQYEIQKNQKTEEKIPKLAEDIRSIVEPESQADPHFQTTTPLKKIPETDAIFENADRVNRQADESLNAYISLSREVGKWLFKCAICFDKRMISGIFIPRDC